MKPIHRGLLLGLVQLGIVSLLAGKLHHDRATRPRVWAQTEPVDPYRPIRGRYVDLSVRARARGLTESYERVALRVEGNGLVAVPDPLGNRPFGGSRVTAVAVRDFGSEPVTIVTLVPSLAFFIPEHVEAPARRPPGEELWVEVTVPEHGPPRPLRLGVKRGEGAIRPL